MGDNIKWASVLSEIERSIPNLEKTLDFKVLLDRFESTDEDYRDQNFSHLYLSMWRVAFNAGKLNLANKYSKKALNYLIKYKRIPQIKSFIQSLHDAGLIKKDPEEFLRKRDILIGKKNNIAADDFKNIDLMEDHPEHWKEFPEFLKQYLLLDPEWSIDQWKLCYEFILLNHFERNIFFSLMEKSHERKNNKFERKFTELFAAKKVRVRKLESFSEGNPTLKENEKLHVDYDQMAMDLLSGTIEPTDDEQKRVLSSLKYIPEEELLSRGQDMIIAFELLGMEQVVLNLCERMVGAVKDVKQLASIYFVWAQALSNIGDYFKAIDLVDGVLNKEPLYEEERLAFIYLKAEACLKLKKIKIAKELYLEIKKQNPHYRLVRERLKAIETA